MFMRHHPEFGLGVEQAKVIAHIVQIPAALTTNSGSREAVVRRSATALTGAARLSSRGRFGPECSLLRCYGPCRKNNRSRGMRHYE